MEVNIVLKPQNCISRRNESQGKSLGDSKRFRELGNQAFKLGKDEAALRHYNEAVISAPNDKPELALALANL